MLRCPHCTHEFDPADALTPAANPNASCPVPGHEGNRATNCPACRSELLAAPREREPIPDRYRTQETS